MSLRRRLSLLLVVGALAAGGAGASAAPASPAPLSHCKAGWVDAHLSWGHKCLKAGQFCKRGNREYARFGFACPSGRLVRR